MTKPRLINFNSIGKADLGFISVAEHGQSVPFHIKRVYWTYFTPQNVVRGGHANINKEMILIAVAGTIKVKTETVQGSHGEYVLSEPSVGLYIPKLCWHEMKYTHNSVQVVLASNEYSVEDYIREYKIFQKLKHDS